MRALRDCRGRDRGSERLVVSALIPLCLPANRSLTEAGVQEPRPLPPATLQAWVRVYGDRHDGHRIDGHRIGGHRIVLFLLGEPLVLARRCGRSRCPPKRR